MVVSVVPTDKGVDVICLDGGEIRGIHCEKAIFASPMFTAPYLIRGFREDAPFAANEFQHNAWFVANLFLKDRPKPRFAKDFPLSWDNVLYESPSLGYVTATHQKGIDYGPTILTYYYPMCHEPNGRTKLFNYDWKQLADVCLTDLARAHPDIYELTDAYRHHALGPRDDQPAAKLYLERRPRKSDETIPQHPFCPHRPQRHRTFRRSVLSWTCARRTRLLRKFKQDRQDATGCKNPVYPVHPV